MIDEIDKLQERQPGEAPDITDAEAAAHPDNAEQRNDKNAPEPVREELNVTVLAESYGLRAADEPQLLVDAIVEDFGTVPPKYARILAAAGYPLPADL